MTGQPLPAFELQGSGNIWSGLYTALTEAGRYRFVLYAEDNDGLQSRPKEVTVTLQRLYLPLVVKE